MARNGFILPENLPFLDSPSLHAVGYDHRGEPVGRGMFRLEAEFPCKRYLATRRSPFMGYAGVIGWANLMATAALR